MAGLGWLAVGSCLTALAGWLAGRVQPARWLFGWLAANGLSSWLGLLVGVPGPGLTGSLAD